MEIICQSICVSIYLLITDDHCFGSFLTVAVLHLFSTFEREDNRLNLSEILKNLILRLLFFEKINRL